MRKRELQTKKKTNVTIKEVAELARVSQMTVSRVLNDQDVVKQETRDRVISAIRALNYRPSAMARNLAGRKSLFIGLLYRNPSFGYISEFLLGALDTCRELGHYLIVEEPFIDDNIVDFEKLEKRFRDTNIEALIVVPPLSEDPILIGILERIGIPYVSVSPHHQLNARMSIGMNDHAAAYEMTAYLHKLGHERIAIVAGPADHGASSLRLAGYKQAMKDAGLSIDTDLIAGGDFTHKSGITAGINILSSENPPTAIFAANDDMAIGVIAAAHEMGIRVPEDISVVGFDDTKNASECWPPLTTIRQPIREMAKSALTMLDRRSKTQSAERESETLNYELINRSSSAPLSRQRLISQ